MSNKEIPELFYYADNLMHLGNFSVIDVEAVQIVHQMNWDEIEPRTHIQNDENQLCPSELRRNLFNLIRYVSDNDEDPKLPSAVGNFFEDCVRSGYKTIDELVQDTGLENFDENDLRSVFFKFIHPALVKKMPDDFKPQGLRNRLDDSGMVTPPSPRPRGGGRTRQP